MRKWFGILYSWLKKMLNLTTELIDYNGLNNISEKAPPGSLNLRFSLLVTVPREC